MVRKINDSNGVKRRSRTRKRNTQEEAIIEIAPPSTGYDNTTSVVAGVVYEPEPVEEIAVVPVEEPIYVTELELTPDPVPQKTGVVIDPLSSVVKTAENEADRFYRWRRLGRR